MTPVRSNFHAPVRAAPDPSLEINAEGIARPAERRSQVHSDGEPGQEGREGLRWQAELHAGEPVAGSAIQGHRRGSPGAEPAGSGDSAPGWWSSTTAAATPLKGIGNRFRPSCRESLLPAAHRGKLAILISRIAREESTVLRHPIDQPDTADCRPGDRQHRGAFLVLGPGGTGRAGARWREAFAMHPSPIATARTSRRSKTRAQRVTGARWGLCAGPFEKGVVRAAGPHRTEGGVDWSRRCGRRSTRSGLPPLSHHCLASTG